MYCSEIESGPIFIPRFPKILIHFNTKNLDFRRQNITQFCKLFERCSEIFEKFIPKFMNRPMVSLVTDLRKFEKWPHTNFATKIGFIVIPGGWFCYPFQRHKPTLVIRTLRAGSNMHRHRPISNSTARAPRKCLHGYGPVNTGCVFRVKPRDGENVAI